MLIHSEEMQPYSTSTNPSHGTDARRRVASPQFGLAHVSIEPRPGDGSDDDANTAQTVRLMLDFIQADAFSTAVTAATREATGGETGDQAAWRIFQWIKNTVTFQEDFVTALLASLPNPQAAEVLIRPVDLLSMARPAGDCDDFSMLANAMLTNAGVPARLRTIEQNPAQPGQYSHIFSEAMIGGQWVPFDTSHGTAPGWQAHAIGKDRTWTGAQRMSGRHTAPRGLHGLGINWDSVIDQSFKLANQVIPTRYGAPGTPGASVRLPNGQIATNNPVGSSVTFPSFSATTTGGMDQNTVIIGGGILALVLVLAVAKKG